MEDQGGRAGGAVSATSLQRLAARALRRTPWASASASLQPSPAREYLLQVVYKDTYNTTGWDRLEVRAHHGCTSASATAGGSQVPPEAQHLLKSATLARLAA